MKLTRSLIEVYARKWPDAGTLVTVVDKCRNAEERREAIALTIAELMRMWDAVDAGAEPCRANVLVEVE
jgi:hypothetical protein